MIVSFSNRMMKSARMLAASAPLSLFYVTEILLGLTDLFVVGALGATELAAVGLGKTIVFSYLTAGFALVAPSLAFLAERRTSARRQHVFVSALGLGLLYALLAFPLVAFVRAYFIGSSYSDGFAAAFDQYTFVLAATLFPAIIYSVLKNLLNVEGLSWMLVPLSVVMVATNLALTIVAVHGLGSFEGFGVLGAALATAAINTLAAVFLTVVCVRRGLLKVFGRLRPVLLSSWTGRMWRLGWAASAQQVLESALFTVILLMLGTVSEAWVAAGTLAFAVMEVNFAASSALGELGAARIAALRLRGRRAEAWDAAMTAVLACSMFTLAYAATIFLMAGPVTRLMISGEHDADTIAIAETLLRWTTIVFVFDALQILYINLFRGIKITVVPMVTSSVAYWGVGLAGAAILNYGFGAGGPGIWMAFCLALITATVLLTETFRRVF